jgi:predicted MFS family arabinose efflux permease
VVTGLVASGLGSLLLGLARTPAELVLGRVVAGAAAACWVALLVLAVGAYPAAKLTEAMSAITVVGTVAEAAAVFAGGVLAEQFGWTAPFYVAAGLAALGLLPAGQLGDAAQGGEGRLSWAHVLHAATRSRLLVVSATTALVTLTVYVTTYGFLPVYALQQGATQADIGILAMLAQAGFAAGAVLAGRAVSGVAAPGLLVTGAGLVACASAAVPLLSGLFLLQCAQLLGGLGRGLVNPVAAALALSRVPDSERTTSMGVYQAAWALGIVVGPPLAGWIADWQGLTGAFLTGAAASALAAFLGGWLWLRPAP